MTPLPRAYMLPFLLFLSLSYLPAQGPHPAFRNYTTDHGLPSSEVYEVLQDRRGYLWFGTDNGVSRFNGYEFENYGPEQGLASNVVFYLHEDHRGRIWMVTLSENLYYYDYDQDSILAFPHNEILQREIEYNQGEMGIYVDTLNNLYRSISHKGIIRISPEGKPTFFGLTDELYRTLLVEVEGVPLLSYRNRLKKPFRDTLSSIPLFVSSHFGETPQKMGAFKIEPENFATTVQFYPLQQDRHLLYLFKKLHLIQNKRLAWSTPSPDFTLTSAYQATDQSILLGGYFAGIRKYSNLEGLKQNNYTTYLPGNTIAHILQDSEERFWFTSTQNGIFFLPNWAFSIYDKSSGLPDQNITAIAVANDSLLYFALKNGALFELNTVTQTWHAIPSPGQGEIPSLFWAAGQNRLYVPSGRGLYYFNPKFQRQLKTLEIFKINPKKFQLSPSGQQLNISANRGFICLTHANNATISNRIRRTFDIHEDQSGHLWVGQLSGLFEYKKDTLVKANLDHPALSTRVEEIDEFSDGRLVFATKGKGIVIWDGTHFQNISVRQGLTSSMVEQIHIDTDKNLWVGTQNGLNKVSFLTDSTYKIQQFTTANGLPSNEINDIQTQGAQVWVATAKGLVTMPKNTPIQERSQPPIIEQFRVNGTAFQPDSLPKLSYRQNNIQITFLTLDFSQNGRINYRYRLLPNTSWNNSQQRTIDLLSLPPDQYTFEVQSQNKDGFWSAPTSISLFIRPPFWQRAWFWVILVIAIAGILYLYYRNRLNRLKEEVALQKQIAEKEREMNKLQRSALRAQMNPHFLSNCMNTIQSFIAKGEKVTAMRYLSNFNRLLRRALNFTQVDHISLEEEIQLLKDYIELERMRFGDRFQYHISVDKQLNLFDTEIPPMLIQPFVENAILHAFPEEVQQPEITIEYKKVQDGLRVTITDNGIGIKESKRRKASAPAKKRKSYGMGIPARRLKLMNNKKQEPVIVEEWKGEEGNIGGTRVSVLVSS